MKNRLSKVFFLLVCATILCAALSVALAEDTACTHAYAKVERPHDYYDATCKEPGGYTVTVTCSNCGAFMNEYKQSDPSKPINPSAHKFTTTQANGECGTYTQQICTLCGYTTGDADTATHDWQSKSHTAESCKDDSYTYEECSKCGLQRNYQTTSKTTTHTFTKNSPVTTRESTCSVAGEQTQKCDCGEVTKTLPLNKTAHSYGAPITAPGSCTVKEETYEVCSVCQDKHVLKTGDYVHSYTEKDTKSASCITSGTRERSCDICGKVNWSRPIPALGHSITWKPDPQDSTKHQAICTRCNAITASGSHTPNKQNPLCTERVYCGSCGYELRPAGKHSSYVAVDSGDDTNHNMQCKDCGYVSKREKHSYSYVGSYCTNDKVCSVCKHTTSGNASHSLSSSWVGVTGGHARKCTVSGCAYMVSEEHTWGDWFVAYEPTTTRPGTEATRCTKCSATMTRSIPKLTATAAPQATTAPSASDSSSSQTNPPASSGSTNTQTNPPASSGSATPTTAPTTSGSSNSQSSAPAASGSQTNAPAAAGSSNSQPSAPAASGSQTNAPAAASAANNQTTAPAAGTVPPAEAPANNQPIGSTAAPEEHVDSVTAHVAHTARLSCADLGRDCAWEEFLQGGLLVRVCTICGNVNAVPIFSDATTVQPIFQAITGVVVTGATPASGALVLRAASLADENGAISDAYLAISVAWEADGSSVQLEDTVQVSMPLTIGDTSGEEGVLTAPTADFRLVRVDVSSDEARLEEWTDIDFTYEDGVLSFEMEQTGIYLLIPA